MKNEKRPKFRKYPADRILSEFWKYGFGSGERIPRNIEDIAQQFSRLGIRIVFMEDCCDNPWRTARHGESFTCQPEELLGVVAGKNILVQHGNGW